MQQRDSGLGGERLCAFSILSRIGGVATLLRRGRHDRGVLFQYPQSDRRRCNLPAVSRPCCDLCLLSVSSVGSEALQRKPTWWNWRREGLSVSSVGSEALQLVACRGDADDRPRLSVSSVGSEALQPQERLITTTSLSPFQYPQSDRRRCNLPVLDAQWREEEDFQYPQSDRRRCNPPGRGRQPRHPGAFQYPQSDRRRCNVAAGGLLGDGLSAFQYPQSDRRRCNLSLATV